MSPPETPIRILYFDLETKHSADEVGGWGNAMEMGMSVGVIWDSSSSDFHVYLENQMEPLIEHLRKGDLVVGFNHVGFDYKVVSGVRGDKESRDRLYLEMVELNNFDMLVELKKKLGHRIRLDSIARPTLRTGKSADGLQALTWYKEGRIDLIIEYCKQDVDVTRMVFEYAIENGHLQYDSRSGIKTVQLDWQIQPPEKAAAQQMSLFD